MTKGWRYTNKRRYEVNHLFCLDIGNRNETLTNDKSSVLPHSNSCALLTRLVTTSMSWRGSGVVAKGCLSIIFIHISKVSS